VADSHRGGGWGRKLVEEAERIAPGRGCYSAWLGTFSIQSPGFYQEIGHRVFGEMSDYPPDGTRCFRSKLLRPPVMGSGMGAV
jgi:ribosomal protein S18 acetylase RimI-like enzyme